MDKMEFKIKGYALLQMKAFKTLDLKDGKLGKEKSQVFLPAEYADKNVAIILIDEIPPH